MALDSPKGHEDFEAKNRVATHIQRTLDGFQIRLEYRWKHWNQVWAFWINFAFVMLVWLAYRSWRQTLVYLVVDFYHHELSVRTQPAGGPVAASVEEGPDRCMEHAGRVILFVHGYNNTLDVAREAYETFAAGLAERVPEATAEIVGPLYRFYWPGDEDLGLISFISYPVETRDARESATRLVDFLRKLYGAGSHPALPLDIVSHSLGGRVVLETLTALANTGMLDRIIKRVCLMAPAVLVERVEPGGPLYDGARLPEALTILTSEDDWVLWLAFPLGQTIAEGGSGRALGRYGPPPGLPARHEPVSGGVGHTQYWDCPAGVAGVIIDALGFTPRWREVAGRSTPARETASPRTIEGRALGGP